MVSKMRVALTGLDPHQSFDTFLLSAREDTGAHVSLLGAAVNVGPPLMTR